MKESPREICNKKIIANNLASLAVAYETREKARNALLNINTPRSKKNKSSVEQFV
jgi:hypothetical protein